MSSTLTEQKRELLYYQTIWKKESLKSIPIPLASAGSILLFDIDNTRYTNINSYFNHDVILVVAGESYQKLDETNYTIRPTHLSDYQQLLTNLKLEPSYIIHLWSQAIFNIEKLPIQLKMSLFSIFYLSQALLALRPKKRIKVLYAYLYTSKVLQPHYAALHGFSKTLHQETSKITTKIVGLSNLENIAKIAVNEFQTLEKSHIRYKDEQRWVKNLEKLNSLPKSDGTSELKENGIYLITGGAGGLGLFFAEYLAKYFQATLILTGRSSLSQQQQHKIKALEALGATVVYKRADISKCIDVALLITDIKSEFHSLNGIIHAAGVIKNQRIAQKNSQEVADVIAPKVYGVSYLDELTKDQPLDFFMLFSSVVAEMDNIGQCDYAYANAFLDNFAEQREKFRTTQKRFGKTISINWPLWQSGGMQVNGQIQKWLIDVMGMFAISNDTGIIAFNQGLAFEKSQLVVIDGYRNKIEKSLGIKTK